VLKDDKQAVYWYQKAADQGYAEAQSILGVMYANGKGVLKDDKQAVYWYQKAADQGLAEMPLISCFLIPIHGLFIIF
jgi:TPR repeat protein